MAPRRACQWIGFIRRWRRAEPLAGRSIHKGEREVGSVRSTLSLEDRAIGLGLIRREVGVGEELLAGGQPATVVALPFGPEDLDG